MVVQWMGEFSDISENSCLKSLFKKGVYFKLCLSPACSRWFNYNCYALQRQDAVVVRSLFGKWCCTT